MFRFFISIKDEFHTCFIALAVDVSVFISGWQICQIM